MDRRYEDYLDSQITGTDMYYLEDLELARQLVELGWVCAWQPAPGPLRCVLMA